MASETILAVDDEPDLLEVVRYNLDREGYIVECVATGEMALKAAKSITPNLILLDLMLPGVDGLEVCRDLKAEAKTRNIPIVMLTAKGEEADIVLGLEMGADDYITKPFSPRVLVARVRAVLRRQRAARSNDDEGEDSVVCIHGLSIDPERHEVKIQGKAIDLTATEFRVLHHMALHPGRVFTRQQIIEAVRGDDYPVTERSVDVQIVSLRRKLDEDQDLIETIRGVGYRFRE